MKKILILIFSVCFFISNSQTTILSENFSSGMIPSSWTVSAFPSNTCGGFQYQSSQTWNTSTITGSHISAWSYSPTSQTACQSGTYIMIPFNGSGFNSIDIELDHYFYNYQNNDTAEIFYSINSGVNWTLLQDFTGSTTSGTLNYNITTLSSNMILGIQHKGYDGYGWDIDNIVITGYSGANPSWDCVNNTCVIYQGTGIGPFTTQAACLTSGCGTTLDWGCVSAGNCQDLGTGNGQYLTQAACQAQCVPVSASFSANITAACVGQNIQFTDASSGNPTSHLWDFGDGNSSIQSNPSHQYTSAGTYTVTLDVSNAIGSTDNNSQINYIVVIDAVDATWTSNPAGQANIGQIISFTADSVAPTTWDWDWDDFTINGSGPNETHSYSNTGTYNVCLTVTNSCSNDSSCQLIEILDPCLSSTEIYLTNIAFTSSVDEVGTIWETNFIGLPTSLVKPTTNPSNLLNAGRKVSFKIECRNEKVNGQAIVSGMCEIISSDPYITIIDGTAGLNNVAWQNEAWSTDEFTIEIDNDAPAGYLANIEFKVIEGSITEYTRCVKIPVQPLTISNIDIDDDSNPDSDGDDDDICEPGETIEVYPYVDNVSLLEAGLVAGTMTCSNPNINIWDGQSGISGTVEKDAWWNVSFGNPSPIAAGETGMTPEFDFVFDYNLNQVAPVPLTVVFTGGFQLFDINGSAKSALIRFSSDYYINEGLLNSTEDIATNNLIKIFPNPFKEIVTIEANISEPYTLKLYDVTGKLLRDYKNINNDKLVIERGSLNSGVYLLKIINDSDIRMGRLIIE